MAGCIANICVRDGLLAITTDGFVFALAGDPQAAEWVQVGNRVADLNNFIGIGASNGSNNLVAITPENYFVSTNNGINWQRFEISSAFLPFAGGTKPSNTAILLITKAGGWLFSNDNGSSFPFTGSSGIPGDILQVSGFGNDVFIVNDKGVGGTSSAASSFTSWTKWAQAPLSNPTTIRGVANANRPAIVQADGTGVFANTPNPNANDWKPWPSHPGVTNLRALIAAENLGFVMNRDGIGSLTTAPYGSWSLIASQVPVTCEGRIFRVKSEEGLRDAIAEAEPGTIIVITRPTITLSEALKILTPGLTIKSGVPEGTTFVPKDDDAAEGSVFEQAIAECVEEKFAYFETEEISAEGFRRVYEIAAENCANTIINKALWENIGDCVINIEEDKGGEVVAGPVFPWTLDVNDVRAKGVGSVLCSQQCGLNYNIKHTEVNLAGNPPVGAAAPSRATKPAFSAKDPNEFILEDGTLSAPRGRANDQIGVQIDYSQCDEPTIDPRQLIIDRLTTSGLCKALDIMRPDCEGLEDQSALLEAQVKGLVANLLEPVAALRLAQLNGDAPISMIGCEDDDLILVDPNVGLPDLATLSAADCPATVPALAIGNTNLEGGTFQAPAGTTPEEIIISNICAANILDQELQGGDAQTLLTFLYLINQCQQDLNLANNEEEITASARGKRKLKCQVFLKSTQNGVDTYTASGPKVRAKKVKGKNKYQVKIPTPPTDFVLTVTESRKRRRRRGGVESAAPRELQATSGFSNLVSVAPAPTEPQESEIIVANAIYDWAIVQNSQQVLIDLDLQS